MGIDISWWVVNGTYANVYQTTISSANSSGVVDLTPALATVPSYVDPVTGLTVSCSNVPKAFATYTKLTSIAAVAAQAGSWYNDGTTTYVNPKDGRSMVGDTYVWCLNTANVGRMPNLNGITIHLTGLDFVGGRPWYSFCGATITASGGASGQAVINTVSTANVANGQAIQGTGIPAGATVLSFVANTSITISTNLTATASGTYNLSVPSSVLAHNNCSFQASTASNGLNVQAAHTTYGYRSLAAYNFNDGFNYHSFEADGTTNGTSPNWIEVECVSVGNGTTGSSATSDNASTCHDYCNGIRLNGSYINSDDRPLADVNFSNTWNISGFTGQSIKTGAGNQNVVVLDNAKVWVDSMKLATGTNDRLNADVSSTMYVFNLATNVNTSGATGTVRNYIA